MGKIVHIVLQKMNEGADQKVYNEWLTEGPKMKDQIPGIETMKFGPCLPSMQHRTKFTHMLYSIFESEEALKTYQTHPVHVKFQGIGGSIFSDKTVFDLEL